MNGQTRSLSWITAFRRAKMRLFFSSALAATFFLKPVRSSLANSSSATSSKDTSGCVADRERLSDVCVCGEGMRDQREYQKVARLPHASAIDFRWKGQLAETGLFAFAVRFPQLWPPSSLSSHFPLGMTRHPWFVVSWESRRRVRSGVPLPRVAVAKAKSKGKG